MQETFMSDSEDEGGEDPMMSDQQQYRYMTVDDMKSLGDDSRLDVTHDEKHDYRSSMAPSNMSGDVIISPAHAKDYYASNAYSAPDNIDINRQPIQVGFLVSFMVDARGGAMRGCRHSGVRIIVPPRCAASPTRITCRYVKPERTPHPPPLMEGEALASRVLELQPVGTKFLGPVILEIPHFASLRGKQREIVVLRSDNGETWREHTLESNEEAIQDVLNHSFEGDDLNQIEDLHTSRITRILTNDFPHYFAVVSRVRQEIHAIGPDGGTVSSSAVPQVQAVFPPNALTKKIRVGLQAQPIEPDLVAKLLGHGVAVSPVVTVEPRRRKFHKAITLSMPAPRAHSQGMINQYSGSAPTLRLLCSITGGQSRAVWEDVTGSTPLTFVKDCVAFTTTVSARFWLMDCRNVADAARMATDLYTQAAHVPFMAKFVVFAKRISTSEARIRVFCMTDDKEDKTLEIQEHFTEIAKSRDIEVLEGKNIYMEFAGNLIPVLKSGEQPVLGFRAFKENRLAFTMRVRDLDEDTVGRIMFMADARVAKGEPAQTPLCTLNLVLPSNVIPDLDRSDPDLLAIDKDLSYLRHGISKPDTIHKADIRLTDICNLLGDDWQKLANELGVPPSDVKLILNEYPNNTSQQAMVMIRLWLRQYANKATGNTLEMALNKIDRADIVSKCICNVELVTDDMEKALAKVQLDQSGFNDLKDELGPSRDTSLRRDATMDKTLQSSTEELDSSQFDNKDKTDQSSDNEMKDLISDYLTHKKNENKNIIEKENEIETKPDVPLPSAPAPPTSQDELFEEITEQFNKMETMPRQVITITETETTIVVDDNDLYTSSSSPPPSASPIEYNDKTNEPIIVEPDDVDEHNYNNELTNSDIISSEEGYQDQDDTKQQCQRQQQQQQQLHDAPENLLSKKESEFIEEKYEPSMTPEINSFDNDDAITINHLKKNISDTLSFIHQERNDFLPNDEIVLPLNNTELTINHTANIVVSSDMPNNNNNNNYNNDIDIKINDNDIVDKFDISYSSKTSQQQQQQVQNETPSQIYKNDDNIDFDDNKFLETATTNELNKTLDESCSILAKKSEEAFSFLEHEDDKSLSPVIEIPAKTITLTTTTTTTLDDGDNDDDNKQLITTTTTNDNSNHHVDKSKSAIPKLKQNKKEKYLMDEKDVDLLLLSQDDNDIENDILSRIPVSASKNVKVKTIKKHSKDPLKEFVKMVNADGSWDETKLPDGTLFEKTTVTTTSTISEPEIIDDTTTTTVIEYPTTVTTTTTTISSSSNINNNNNTSDNNSTGASPKSKIPILIDTATAAAATTATALPTATETTTTTKFVVNSPTQESKRELVDSDSDTDSRQSPPLRGILKKSSMRTLGSSSGSDIALHEAGGELSDDDTASDIYQQNDQPIYTEQVIEEFDPVTNTKVTRTVRTLTQSLTSPEENGENIRQSMQQILDQFMTEERNNPQ